MKSAVVRLQEKSSARLKHARDWHPRSTGVGWNVPQGPRRAFCRYPQGTRRKCFQEDLRRSPGRKGSASGETRHPRVTYVQWSRCAILKPRRAPYLLQEECTECITGEPPPGANGCSKIVTSTEGRSPRCLGLTVCPPPSNGIP
ncbi:hypothetical protein NDU88_004118 [Pleurodeles waltl]|uniref:Uncharacterized protein n=1 Tax=Pleurodeles waltl TaxID=8319 RepID=A0AAV7W767_PLEWA|nr:hypothetical protein NDU88_004118 [Pleurodeles waltl]